MRKVWCVLVCGLFALLGLIVYINVFVENATEWVVVNYGQYEFHEYEDGSGVFTIRDICIERRTNSSSNDNKSNKIIVIYNSDHTSEREELLKDRHSGNAVKFRGWPVVYQQGQIPKQHAIMDHPAYFMVTTCEGNLHHINDDSLRGKTPGVRPRCLLK